MRLSYGQIEAVFSSRYGIEASNVGAFRGRLQHLQRLQFPQGINTGKGKRAVYGWQQFIQLSLALDLIDLGLSPESTISLITKQWVELEIVLRTFPALCEAPEELQLLIESEACDLERSTWALIDINAISAMAKDSGSISLCSGPDFRDRVINRDPFASAFIALDVTTRLLHALNNCVTLNFFSSSELAADFSLWSDEYDFGEEA